MRRLARPCTQLMEARSLQDLCCRLQVGCSIVTADASCCLQCLHLSQCQLVV
jgi:hypothetical protein